MKKHDSLSASFRHAFEGIAAAVKKERNIKIHLVFVVLVTAAGFIFDISAGEWLVCVLLFGLVIAAELFNTAIETLVDIASPEQSEPAKIAKDVSAGAVLVCALASVVAGIIIFLPKLIALFVRS